MIYVDFISRVAVVEGRGVLMLTAGVSGFAPYTPRMIRSIVNRSGTTSFGMSV